MRGEWIDEAIRDITGLVLDLGAIPPSETELPASGKLLDEATAEPWRQAEANADRVMRGLPPEWAEPPTSTLEAARYVASLDDPERAEAFAAGRSPAELAAILKFLKGIEP
jgi:hypothetical protein